jgi:hypothetical protein
MSTKIYTGFRMKARVLRAVLDDLQRVLVRCEALLVARQNSFLANVAVDALDTAALAGLPGFTTPAATETPTAPIYEAWNLLSDRQAEVRRTQRRDPAVDFEVIFRLWLCRKTGSFVGYVIGENAQRFLNELLRGGVATEYGYWNNVDPLESQNERQWKKRGDVWDGLLAGKSGPWFDVRVAEPLIGWGVSDAILAAVPSLDSRVAPLAHKMALSQWFAAQPPCTVEVGEALSSYFDFRELERAGDAAVTKLLATAKATVRARLAPVVTKALLSCE